MSPSDLVRATRRRLGWNQRTFAAALGSVLVSGCSLALVSKWELGNINVSYEKMYYLYTHAGDEALRDMAAGIMREIDAERADMDLCTGKIGVDTL